MFKVIATDVVISKGYDGAPALKFSENGESVRFRIGKKVYDTRAENNTRWVNLSVKAFGPVCERIKKMQLKESSFINILGRLDEDVWEDSTTHEKRSAMVVILDEINVAWQLGLVKEEEMLELLSLRSEQTELVFTGRGCPDRVLEQADLITEMRPIRHYYQTKGLLSREGIEC